MAAHLTPAEARKIGLDPKLGRTRTVPRSTRRTVRGVDYHTICQRCGEHFHVQAAEDRHVEATKHANYRIVVGP